MKNELQEHIKYIKDNLDSFSKDTEHFSIHLSLSDNLEMSHRLNHRAYTGTMSTFLNHRAYTGPMSTFNINCEELEELYRMLGDYLDKFS